MKVCGNCRRALGENDKYCKHCGTARREIEAEAVKRGGGNRGSFAEAIYGPPYCAKYVCPKCGNVYLERGIGCAGKRYCVECGAEYELAVQKNAFAAAGDEEFQSLFSRRDDKK